MKKNQKKSTYVKIKGTLEAFCEQGVGWILGLYLPKGLTPNPQYDGIKDKVKFFKSLEHFIGLKKFDQIKIVNTNAKLKKYKNKIFTIGDLKKAQEDHFRFGHVYPFESIDLKDWITLFTCDSTKVILLKRVNKVAYFGGSFDPIHIGHVNIVNEILHSYDLVILMPCLNKSKNPLFSLKERIKACKETFKENRRVLVLDWANKIDTSSTLKMVNTIEKVLKVPRPEILIGSDCLEGIENWKNWDLLKKEKFIIFQRKGHSPKEGFEPLLKKLEIAPIVIRGVSEVSSTQVKANGEIDKIPKGAIPFLSINKIEVKNE